MEDVYFFELAEQLVAYGPRGRGTLLAEYLNHPLGALPVVFNDFTCSSGRIVDSVTVAGPGNFRR